MLPRLVLDYLRSAAAREWVRQGTSGRGEDICHDPARVAPSKCNLPPRANHMSTVIMLAWRGGGRVRASVMPPLSNVFFESIRDIARLVNKG